jgi:hypothetical protein
LILDPDRFLKINAKKYKKDSPIASLGLNWILRWRSIGVIAVCVVDNKSGNEKFICTRTASVLIRHARYPGLSAWWIAIANCLWLAGMYF